MFNDSYCPLSTQFSGSYALRGPNARAQALKATWTCDCNMSFKGALKESTLFRCPTTSLNVFFKNKFPQNTGQFPDRGLELNMILESVPLSGLNRRQIHSACSRMPLTFVVRSPFISANRGPSQYVFHATLGSLHLISRSTE